MGIAIVALRGVACIGEERRIENAKETKCMDRRNCGVQRKEILLYFVGVNFFTPSGGCQSLLRT
jgi:hypothetical protein